MFTTEENERLTRVGPGTPMGEVLRRFWIPALLPEELPEPDCAPVRVRLLCEDLVAFRDTEGKVGVLDRWCPHRRVDLFFGRNEECGLRCVYHGWKFNTRGDVVDMPAEPANSPMRDEVKIKSYPTMEWGGLIWIYMGAPEHMPPRPPELEWGLVPETHRMIGKRLQENNYAQAVEGGIDSSHVGILHSLVAPPGDGLTFRERQRAVDPRLSYLAKDTAPKFFVRKSDYGMLIGARRNASEEEFYWRITQFLAPFYTMIAPRGPQGPIAGHAWVPIDDYNTWTYTMYWSPTTPMSEFPDLDSAKVNVDVVNDGSYRSVNTSANNYGLDRAMQRNINSTGINGIGLQDAAVQETMGAIVDRSREMLGSGDAAIVAWRKLMLGLADELASTDAIQQANKPDIFRVRSAGVVLPRGVDFEEGARDAMTVA